MKKVIATSTFFIFFILVSFSQNSHNLSYKMKGIVVDSVSTETVPYATVSVTTVATPDVYQKRMATGTNGEFELELTKTGGYFLIIESLGMKTLTREIKITPEQKNLNLGKLILSPSSKKLTEVTITASKPLVKVDLDKISYDTKSDPEAQSISVLEMLRKVPLVTVDANDNIHLKGSSNIKIFMNGKETGMMTNNPSQVLKSMPASSVKSIEVIIEPSVKYDAEGIGGIINIVTDHSLKGLTGTVRSGVNTKGGYNGGLYLSTKKGKFGLTTNLNYRNSSDKDQTYDRDLKNFNSKSVKYIHQYANSDSKFSFYYGNLEAIYEFDSLNIVSLTLGGYGGGNSSIDDAGTNFMSAQGDTLSAFKQLTKSNNSWGGLNLSLDYQHAFKKPEQLLTISYRLNHTPDNTDNTSAVTRVLNYTDYTQHILYNANGDEHTFQVDYTEPFNKIHVLDAGIKYILRLNNSVNNYFLLNQTTNAWYPMPNQPKNNLNQTQNIFGAYASYTLKLDKFSARAGLRFEETTSGILLSDTSFQVNFSNLLPSVSLGYKVSDANNLKLSYSQRISRPGIWYLNPFLNNSNPLSLTQGNPDLIPERNNTISFNYSYISSKLTLNTSLFTSFTNNSIERVTKSLTDSVVYNTYKNIGLYQTDGLSLYANWQPDESIQLSLNGNVGYTLMKTNDGSGLKNDGFNYSVFLDGEFRLPYKIKFSAYSGYYSSRINLQGQNSAIFYYGVSASRDFLKERLNVSVSARNPFPKRKYYSGYSQTIDYRVDYNQSMIVQSFGLSVSYKFGELKDQIKKVSKTIENDDVKSGGAQGGGG